MILSSDSHYDIWAYLLFLVIGQISLAVWNVKSKIQNVKCKMILSATGSFGFGLSVFYVIIDDE